MNRQQLAVSYLIALVFYVVLSATVTLVIYQDQKHTHDKWINTALENGIESMAAVLPDNLQLDALAQKPLAYQDEKDLAFLLGELAQSHSLAYLYTLIQTEEGGSKFVISSPSPEELYGSLYESVYLTSYDEMGTQLAPFFLSAEDHYLEYTDRWGEFRSIYRQGTTADGRAYLLGADIGIAEVNKALLTSVLKTIAGLVLLFIVCIPLLLLIHFLGQRELSTKIQLMYIDPLTGLSNREALRRALETSRHPQVLLLNVLRFADINGAFGPAVGDQVLRHFAKHLANFSHPDLNDVRTYRLHGDEFVFLIDQAELPSSIDQVFSDFLSYVSSFEYKAADEVILRLQVATGAVLDQQTDHVTLAQIALNSAMDKSLPLVVFDENLAETSHFKDNLEQLKLLKHALRNDTLVPWFQPIFNALTGEIVRYEALVRIVDVNGDILSMPYKFLPVAHRYQLYTKISQAVLIHTLEWLDQNSGKVSINLSISDIENQTIRDFFIKKIKQSGNGHRLSFELLESEAIHDTDQVRRFFYRLKRLGCRLGIDDLGKEYSNFDRILALPLDFIKLDGVIIKHLEKDQEAFTMVQNIVNLAHKKGLSVTAEMISNERRLEIAKELGCDLVQGFYLAKPSPEAFSVEAEGEVA